MNLNLIFRNVSWFERHSKNGPAQILGRGVPNPAAAARVNSHPAPDLRKDELPELVI